ncbi:MAG: ribonuclease P protein component [Minisyncoccia bacterium]
MPRSSRLSRADFKLMRGFRRIQGRFFSLSFGTIAGRSSPGAAIIVSKKTAALAATRNRIKRRGRSVLKEVAQKNDPVLVLVAKKGAAEAAFSDIQKDIQGLVAHAREAR